MIDMGQFLYVSVLKSVSYNYYYGECHLLIHKAHITN